MAVHGGCCAADLRRRMAILYMRGHGNIEGIRRDNCGAKKGSIPRVLVEIGPQPPAPVGAGEDQKILALRRPRLAVQLQGRAQANRTLKKLS